MSDSKQKALQILNELNGKERAELKEELDNEFDLRTPEESEFEEEEDVQELSYRNMYPTTPEFVPFDIETTGLTIQDEVISVGFIFGKTMYLHIVSTGFGWNEIQDILTNADGVGDLTANSILYGFEDPSDVLVATEDQLTAVNGVGEKKAKEVRQAVSQYIETVENDLTEDVREHEEVDELEVSLTLAQDESELIRNMNKDIQDNFIDEYNVFTTFNGHSRYGGFDYKMLAQASYYADFSEHPLNGYGHIDLKTILDDRDVFNTQVREISADALSSSFNAKPLEEVVSRLQSEFLRHVDNLINNTREIQSELTQIHNRVKRELEEDDMYSKEALDIALDTYDSNISDAILAGLVIDQWAGGSRKKDTTKRLAILEAFDTLNLDPVVDAMDEWCSENDETFPSDTRSSLDGMYHAIKTRGNDKADSIDPLNEMSGLVPESFDNGQLEDVILHLADDLIKTRYLSEVMRFSCPSDEFRVTVL